MKLDKFYSGIEKIRDEWKHITKNKNEPMDGDETELISKFILTYLDILEGNLTHREYNKKITKLEKRMIATYIPPDPRQRKFSFMESRKPNNKISGKLVKSEE